jgi:tetratricopeptide (TPR) repeat protein
MKTIKIILAVLAVLFISCKSNTATTTITQKQDYQVYLKNTENQKRKAIETDIQFWQSKFDKTPNQFSYLTQIAGLYSERFEILGNINDLYYAEKLLLQVDLHNGEESAATKRSIARNYISQHRFKEALLYVQQAVALGENKTSSLQMLFDVNMELGNYQEAYKNLNSFIDFRDFNYLIRASKWQDYKGNLDKAIALMENAMKIAEVSKNKDLQLWVYTNIADFYGHNNQYQKSYDYYLKALQLDNHNYYALKGIAWIAFSHERNPNKALEIVNSIVAKHMVPDLYLLQYEIAEFKKDKVASQKALQQYNKMISECNYGEMYNTYNFNLWIENTSTLENAFVIAKREVKNRPTPESFDLLAWSYYKKGDYQKALNIAQNYTIGKSFEPQIVYHNAEIIKATNHSKVDAEVKKDLIASLYELGPSLEKNIKNL